MSDALSAIPESWEPAQFVRDSVRRNGRPLTPKQLHTAQRKGAIPRPKQVLIGGKGSRVFYPPGTSTQLRLYCAHLDRGATIDEAMWHLWAQGWPIGEDAVRARLRRTVRILQGHAAGEGVDAPHDSLVKLVSGTGIPLARFGRVMDTLLRGDFVHLPPGDERVLATVIKVPTIDDKGIRLLSDCLVDIRRRGETRFSWAQLLEARDEGELLWAILPSLIAAARAHVSSASLEPAAAMLLDPLHTQPFLLHLWLRLRQHAGVARWFAQLKESLDQAGGYLAVIQSSLPREANG